MLSANGEKFIASLPIWMPFISFCCMIGVARTSSTMLSRSEESGHPCLVPDLRGNTLSFSLWSMMFAVGFSQLVFIMLSNVPSKPTLLRVFIKNEYWGHLGGSVN